MDLKICQNSYFQTLFSQKEFLYQYLNSIILVFFLFAMLKWHLNLFKNIMLSYIKKLYLNYQFYY
jgi:hypothetical protein